jgi:hypothetical protein
MYYLKGLKESSKHPTSEEEPALPLSSPLPTPKQIIDPQPRPDQAYSFNDRIVPNKTIKDENSGLLREAVEPHQIHEK